MRFILSVQTVDSVWYVPKTCRVQTPTRHIHTWCFTLEIASKPPSRFGIAALLFAN